MSEIKTRSTDRPWWRCMDPDCTGMDWQPGGAASSAQHMWEVHGLPKDCIRPGVDIELQSRTPLYILPDPDQRHGGPQ